jgi:hypothetical protein
MFNSLYDASIERKGYLKGKREDTLRIINKKFGTIDEKIRNLICTNEDIELLNRIFDFALESINSNMFLNKLRSFIEF